MHPEGENAVELLALVSENPALDYLLRVRVARVFGQAWARGRGLDIGQMVEWERG